MIRKQNYNIEARLISFLITAPIMKCDVVNEPTHLSPTMVVAKVRFLGYATYKFNIQQRYPS